MSLINRVLSQLERRGVRIEPDMEMVRAVSPRRSGSRLPLLLFVSMLLAGAAWWWQYRAVVPDGERRRAPQVVAAPGPVAGIAPQASSGVTSMDIGVSRSGVPVAGTAMSAPVSVVAAAQTAAHMQSALKPGLQPVPKPAPLPAPKPAAQPAPKLASQAAPLPKALASVSAKPVPAAPAKPIVASPAANRTIAPKPDARPNGSRQAAAVSPATGGLPMKQVSRAQQADAEFRRGIELMQRGRSNEAIASYQSALQLDGGHDAARQALVALLLEDKRGSDAERLLQERLDAKPDHAGFAMLLARLQVDRGATGEAMVTLERSLPHAGTRADYLAFLAALQQRNNLHAEAVNHYQAALQLQPDNGAWLMGYGISLQALRRAEEARAAYQKALDSKTLSPDLQAFVQRKLKGL